MLDYLGWMTKRCASLATKPAAPAQRDACQCLDVAEEVPQCRGQAGEREFPDLGRRRSGQDRQAQKLGITRQALIKIWIADTLTLAKVGSAGIILCRIRYLC